MKNAILRGAAYCALAVALTAGAAASAGVPSSAEETFPLTLQLTGEVQGTGADYLEIDLDDLPVTGTHIGIRVNPVYAVDQNGNSPKWSMFRFVFTDKEGKTYDTTNYGGVETTIPAAASDGSATSVTWMYSYLWPLQGFMGTMYLPWALANGGTADNPSPAPTEISKIRIQHNSSYATARREMLAHFFSLTDAVVEEDDETGYMGDVKIIETFETKKLNVTEKKIYDFSQTDLEKITWSANKAMTARFASADEAEDYNALEANAALASWKSKFSVSGQKFSYLPEECGGGIALKWEYGSYYDEYDPKLNSYGSLAIPLAGERSDFRNAKGLTLWVKNPQSYPVSFNLEFEERESGGSERWNLNGENYRTLYFYDTATGEEFSAPTLNVAFIPANFCGWVRIPFSMYNVPSWSLANEWTDGVYDENKPHTTVYITSQFILNDNVTMYFDNLGLYYSDFQTGALFSSEAPGIADCMGVSK